MRNLLTQKDSGKSTAAMKPKTIDNIDQFGRLISKYNYDIDKSGNKYVASYSIYYYLESGQLYKVMDYDGKNQLQAYYLIAYDDAGNQIEIKKYNENGALIYVK